MTRIDYTYTVHPRDCQCWHCQNVEFMRTTKRIVSETPTEVEQEELTLP